MECGTQGLAHTNAPARSKAAHKDGPGPRASFCKDVYV